MVHRILAVLFVAASIVAINVAPASAAYSQCPTGKFCVWTGSGGTGSFAYFTTGDADLRNPIGGVVFDNAISSYWNRTGGIYCMHTGVGWVGNSLQISSGFQGNLGSPFNNTVSSLGNSTTPNYCFDA